MLVVSESQDQLTGFRTELLGLQCFSIPCLKVLANFFFFLNIWL